MQDSIKKENKFLKKNTRELIERNPGSSVVTQSGTEIVNKLDSIDSDKALSANQGRVLKEMIDNVNSFEIVKNW